MCGGYSFGYFKMRKFITKLVAVLISTINVILRAIHAVMTVVLFAAYAYIAWILVVLIRDGLYFLFS